MVKRFNFRLERLLRYRRSLTQRERVNLAREVGVLSEAEAMAAKLRGYANEMGILQHRKLDTGTTSTEVVNLHEHMVRVQESIVNAEADIDKAEDAVEAQRTVLVEKRREERAIELYKARRWKLWLKDYYRDENLTLDDLATMRHVKREK